MFAKLQAAVASIMLFFAVSPAFAIDRGISGLWYNPAQSGHGFELTVVAANTATVTWYTYNSFGVPIWVAGVLTETAPGVLAGNVNYHDGMVFGQFDPNTNLSYPWGSLRFTLESCTAARVEYNGTLRYTDGSGFGAGVVQLQKLAGVQDLSCGATPASALSGVYLGGVTSQLTGAGRAAYALLERSGAATLVVPGDVVYFGGYTFNGSAVFFSVVGQTVPGLAFSDGSNSATAAGSAQGRAADYFTGAYLGAGDRGTFSFMYLGSSTRTPAFASVAGDYVDLTASTSLSASISSSGAVSGRFADGCQFSGTLSTIEATLSAFNLNVTTSGCSTGGGTYSGKALLTDIQDFGDGRGLVVALRGPAGAVAALLHRN